MGRRSAAFDHLAALEDLAANYQRLFRRLRRLNRLGRHVEMTRVIESAAGVPTLYRTPRVAPQDASPRAMPRGGEPLSALLLSEIFNG
jgi:hypothetical protein